jgi:hypothetical protein
VEVASLPNSEDDHGWPVLATTGSAEAWTDTEGLQAEQEQPTSVAPGLRWSKHPAALSPVWLETPARLAAWAMLTVGGLLVYSSMQRQVRLSLRTQEQQLLGNTGETAPPTAAVVLAVCAQVALVQWWLGAQEVAQVYGLQPYHRLICEALGLASSWYEGPSAHKNSRFSQTP